MSSDRSPPPSGDIAVAVLTAITVALALAILHLSVALGLHFWTTFKVVGAVAVASFIWIALLYYRDELMDWPGLYQTLTPQVSAWFYAAALVVGVTPALAELAGPQVWSRAGWTVALTAISFMTIGVICVHEVLRRPLRAC